MNRYRVWFVLAWIVAAIAAALAKGAAITFVVGPTLRCIASTTTSSLAQTIGPVIGRSLLSIIPAAAYGLVAAYFYRRQLGVRWAVATLAGSIASVVLVAILAPALYPASPHRSLIGYLDLEGIGAAAVGVAQWLGVLRGRGDDRGVWVLVVVIATLVDVIVSLATVLPPPTITRGGTVFAIGWPGLVLGAAISGTALALLLRPAASRNPGSNPAR